MMKKIFGLTLLLGAGLLFAFSIPPKKTIQTDSSIHISSNTTGIKFDSLGYDEAVKLSKKTGKPIFIDCYTVWCGPCKMLSSKTFTDPEVGKFFNENFINLKVEMEKDADGPELARLFKVRGYPLLVFVNGEGEMIKQSYGYITPDQLLALGKEVKK